MPLGRVLRIRPDFGWLAYALVLGFAGLTLGPALLGQGALHDASLMSRYFPWSADGVVAPSIWCRGDTVDGVLPSVAAITEGLRHGSLVTWSPYEAGGSPLGSLPSYAVLNPVMWPYLVLPDWLAPAYVKLLQFMVATAGMILFLRIHGVRRSIGALAGLIFCASGFMTMWTNWPQTAVAAWIPLLFYTVDRALTRHRPVDVAALGAVVAAMLLGGFPAVLLYALTAAGVYAAVRLIAMLRNGADGATRGQRARKVVLGGVTAGFGIVLGTALAMVQLLPFARDLKLYLGVRNFRDTHAATGQVFSMLASDMSGSCQMGLGRGPQNPVEAIAFVGAGALVLVCCALAVRLRRSDVAPWDARGLLAILLIATASAVWLGGPVHKALLLLPFYSSNSIARGTVIVGFLAATLAGIGLERLLRRAEERPGSTGQGSATRRPRPWFSALTVLCAIALLGWAWREASNLATDYDYLDFFHDRARTPLSLLALSAVAAVATFTLPARIRLIGPALLAVVVAGQSAAFVHRQLPLTPVEDFYPRTAVHDYLSHNIGQDRFASDNDVLYPATADYFGLRTPLGHQFATEPWKDMLRSVDPDVYRTPTYPVFSAGLPPATIGKSSILDRLAVKYWVTMPGNVIGTRVPGPAATGSLTLASGDTATCALPAGPLRGLSVRLLKPIRGASARPVYLHARVATASGTIESVRAFTRRVPIRRIDLGIAGEALRGNGAQREAVAEIWFTGTRKPAELAARGSDVTCGAIRPAHDGLRLDLVDRGALVYGRATALPRIRWAANSLVEPDSARRLQLVRDGQSADTVVLSAPPARPSGGKPASVRVLADGAEEMAVEVDAAGGGHLVLADSIVDRGWTATVDGKVVPIVAGDHALAAVPLDAGRHVVRVRYTAPGLREGSLISAGAAAVTLLLLLLPLVRRRIRRRDRVGDAG
jgi:hypothetical protein